MGLNEGGGQRTYLKISDGKIAKRVTEETQGAVKCTNKDGSKTWFEKRFASVTGFVTDIKKRETTFGVDLAITICDSDGEVFELQMPWSSRYSSGFFLCMPNINFTREITFTPWMKVVDDVKKTMLYLTHKGDQDNIQWYWTKDNPGDLPQMVKMKVKGQEVWDDTERQEYFEKYIHEQVLPSLALVVRNTPETKVSIEDHKKERDTFLDEMNEPIGNEDDSDKIPF